MTTGEEEKSSWELEKDSWALEQEDAKQPPKLEFQPKASLVLEGSDRHEWGVVKDCRGHINMIPEDAEVVGTWNKFAEPGHQELTFWIALMTPVAALHDRATQLYKELADSRAATMALIPQPTVPKGTRGVSARRVAAKEEPPKVDESFNKMRALLGK